ncbi:MAG: response regulator [Leptolyngbya sp. SIOISBB]|nr:response regulator [Leptolyngbya sp. SIOISBB]
MDDTPANLRLLSRLLSDRGYSIRLAPSGKLALMSIQQSLPDLILLDIRMPQLDGYELCRRLKANDRTCNIPIIFLSALKEEEDKVKAFEMGGVDYITKPFQAEEVSARVRHQLKLLDLQRQLRDQNRQLQQEISDRQQVQAELSRERNLLHTLIDAIPDMVFFKNPEGRYLFWNQAFQDFVGTGYRDIWRHKDTDLFSASAAEHIRAKDQQVLSSGVPLRYEEIATFPNQERRSLDTYKVPVQSADGELLGLMSVCRDVTERKSTEDYLSRTTSRLSSLIRNLQAGILVETEQRKIALTNQEFCELFGVTLNPTDLVGLDCTTLATQSMGLFASPHEAIERINTMLIEGQSVYGEELRLADGRILERDYVPIMAGDRFQGHLWQYRDITRRKADEETLVKSSQALEEFSRNLKQLHRLSLQRFASFPELAADYLKTGCQIMNFAGGLISTVQQETYVIAALETTIDGIQTGFSCDLSDTYCAEAIRTRKTVAQRHFGTTDRAAKHPVYQALGLESFISTPIIVNGEVYGSLCFFSTAVRTTGFDSHEKEIVELMAQSISKYIRSDQIEQQRYQAEVALRESEARFRQLAEHIDSVFWILDPSEQRFTYLSPAYETIWGQISERVLQDAQHWQSTIHPQDVERIAEKKLATQNYDEEYRIQRPDGQIRWIRDRAFPIFDAAGQPYRVVGIAEDITDLKHQERALRLIFEGTATKTGSQFLRSLVRYLADVLQVRYALITQTVSMNPLRVQFLAFWQNEQFGENYELELPESPCAQVLNGETVFHSDQVQSLYPQFQAFRDWNVRSYFGVPLINANDEVIGHLAVLDDRPMQPEQTRELILKIFAARAGAELERQTFENAIQVARESADAANRAKSEFLANMSHELRTPLNSILGFTQLILNEQTIDAKSHDYLDIIYRSGEHLLTLINDVLEMSKIEAGKLSLVTHPFDLHALLHNLRELFGLRAKAKHITLRLICDPEVPQYIETDESKLRQVLINLLSNAVKFTQTGHVTLTVNLAHDAGDTTTASDAVTIVSQSPPILISFAVIDSGIGIAPDELNLLFAPFTQTTAGYRSQEGTGLGLSISQRFVQLMGGEIQVQAALGQGSTFSFGIQALSVPETSVSVSLPPATQLVKALAPGQPAYRILVVDDQPANQLLLVRILEAVGFMVRAVEDGQSAIVVAQEWLPHLIWMDIRMPNLDGYESTRQIRAARLSPDPIIIGLTANVFEDERSRVLAAGGNDFVRKPFTAHQIFQVMARHLPIQYVYSTDSETSLEAAPPDSEVGMSLEAAIAACSGVSPEWARSMRQATIKGADTQILQLLTELPADQSALANALRDWTQNFQFNTILEVLPPG